MDPGARYPRYKVEVKDYALVCAPVNSTPKEHCKSAKAFCSDWCTHTLLEASASRSCCLEGVGAGDLFKSGCARERFGTAEIELVELQQVLDLEPYHLH